MSHRPNSEFATPDGAANGRAALTLANEQPCAGNGATERKDLRGEESVSSMTRKPLATGAISCPLRTWSAT